MRKSNLHVALHSLLFCLGMLITIPRMDAAEQPDKPLMDKAALIKTMHKISTARALDVSEIDIILASLDRLSAKDRRDTALLKEMHTLSMMYKFEEYTKPAKQLMIRKLAFMDAEGLNSDLIYEWQIMSGIYTLEGNLDSAQWYLKKSEAAWKASGRAGDNPYILNTKAVMADLAGQYLEASQLMVQVVEVFKKRDAGLELAVAQLNLSRIYLALGMYEKSIKQAKEAYRIFQTSGTERLLLFAGNNIATVYKKMDSLELAIRWNRENILLARSLNNDIELAKAHMNLGNALSRAGYYAEADRNLDSSLMIINKLDIGYGVMLYHLNKANNYFRMQQPEDALRELREVEKLNKVYVDTQVRQGYYETIYKVYEQLKRYEEAFTYLKISNGIKDSLDKQQASHFLLEWESLIAKERADKEIAELNLAVGKARLNNILIAGMSLLLLLGFYLWFSARYREIQWQKQVAEEQKEKLEVEVDLKNRELTSKVVLNASLGELIADISRRMKRLIPRIGKNYGDELALLVRELEMRGGVDDWKEFETRFTQVHEDFSEVLLGICPDLSPVELKVCSLLRLNMSSKEIAMLTNRTTATVANTRSQIRKKLNLTTDDNLTTFLLSL
jgi:tetratricopeptide (TPR) repeat protein/DNA-binding CsgD family transcriptional regulator